MEGLRGIEGQHGGRREEGRGRMRVKNEAGRWMMERARLEEGRRERGWGGRRRSEEDEEKVE